MKFVKKILLTVTTHAHSQAFLQTAVLTAVAVVLGDFAVLVATALITQLLANRPLEKAFATLTTDGAIMSTCN